jgi:uncharacterized protein
MNCPNCNETLTMTDRQGVEIDYCPKCRGVWLDKGELDKIIDRSAQIQYGDRSTDEYSGYKYGDEEHNQQHKQYPKRKKRGFLGDMFDFD